MQIQPVRNYLTIRIHDGRKTSLALPEGTKVEPYAECVDVGPEVTVCKIGDKLAFMQQGYQCLHEHNGEAFWIICQDIILGILKDVDDAKPSIAVV